MRRLTTLLALGTVLLVASSLQAQRGGGGGHGMGGGGRGFGGGGFRGGSGFHSGGPSRGFAGPSGGFAGPRGFAGPARGFGPTPRGFAPGPRSFSSGSFAPRTFSRSSFGGRSFSSARGSFVTFRNGGRGFRRHHRFFHDRFFSRGCFDCFSPFFFGGGFLFGDPFFPGFFDDPFFSGYGYPYYGGYPPYGYSAPPAEPAYAPSDTGNNAALSAEIQRLTDEVEDLREEERDRARSERRAAASNTSITANEPGLPVEFIFRDGRHISARNYAIAGQTLWILDEHAAKKFGLANLDVDATQQKNAAKGIDLHIIPAAPK
jgi:hypothetical protein